MDGAQGPAETWAVETVADALPDMVARFGPDLRLTYANPALQRASGLGLTEMVGAEVDPAGIATPFAPQLLEALRASAESGEDEYLELHTDLPDGSRRWLELRVIPEKGADGRLASLLAICHDTTQRHREEDARQAAEELVRDLADGIPGFLTLSVLDPRTDPPTATLEYLSDGYRDVTGRAPSTIAAFDQAAEVLHPDDRERWLEDRARIVGGGTVVGEYRIVRPDGSIRWTRETVRSVPQRDGRIEYKGVVVDITGEHEADAAARAAAAQIRTIEQHLQGFLFRASGPAGSPEDLAIEYVGPGFERVLGYGPDDIAALSSLLPLLHPEALDAEERIRGHIADPGSDPTETEHVVDVRLIAKDGASVWMRGPIAVSAEGGRVSVSGLLFDVTERRETEEALANVEKLEGLRVLAAGVAHDFANLLAVVLGNTEVALAELPPDTPAAENLHRAVGAAWHASDLTRQLMAYAGRAALQIEPTDIPTLIEGMRDLLVSTAANAAMLDFELDSDVPLVDGDRTQLSQVVLNLVKNAAEAMDGREGSITIGCYAKTYSRHELDLMTLGESRPAGRFAVLEVRDTGSGMDEETVRRIFDPFFSTKRDGRGLGLASVLGIVRGHHGAVAVRSIPGGGTRISIAIPAATLKAPEREEAAG